MDANSVKLKSQLSILQREYDQLHRDFLDLEYKYNSLLNTEDKEDGSSRNGVMTQLARTVESLYGENLYTDIKIKLCSKTIDAHKLILHARSGYWSTNGELDSTKELDWSDMAEETASGLLQWLYTDKIDIKDEQLALALLEMSYKLQLPKLLSICEKSLIASVNVNNCVRYYCNAENVRAEKLLSFCSELISLYWNDLNPQDFANMSQSLLYKILHSKTKYPLHAAIRLLRMDVVQQYLNENKDNVRWNNELGFEEFYSFYSSHILLDIFSGCIVYF